MAVMSVLTRFYGLNKIPFKNVLIKPSSNNVAFRFMSGGHERTMEIVPSNFMRKKFYDTFQYYLLLTGLPLAILTFATNVFIGPAELAEIPEGYEPKHWEYYRHPISRFLARYAYPSKQQEYEKHMHYLNEEHEKVYWRKLEDKVHELQKERQDYKAWFYMPVEGKYHRSAKLASDEFHESQGIKRQPLADS